MFAGERGRGQQQAGTEWLADFAAAVRRGLLRGGIGRRCGRRRERTISDDG